MPGTALPARGWRATALCWLLAGVLLAGCESTAPTAGVAAGATAPAPADPKPVDPNAPGALHFILSPSGAGNYYNWQIQILAAEKNKGFRPFVSRTMDEGQSLRAELWPDRYHVRVFLLGDVERDEWVEVAAGRPTVVYVDISFLTNDIEIAHGAEAVRLVAEAGRPDHEMRVTQMFEPLMVELRPGLRGRYQGPQRAGQPVGQGRLQLLEGEEEIAVVETAVVEGVEFRGTPVFEDGRRVEGPMGPGYAFAEGTVTTWPDGRRFEGRYDGFTPREGRLTYPDGREWAGPVEALAPHGPGQLTLADGTVIAGAPGSDTATFDGAYVCSPPQGEATTCFYFEGERIATSATYQEKVGAREQARAEAVMALVAAAPAPASPAPEPQPAAAAPAAPAPKIDGCTHVEGTFTADGGLSRLTLAGAGKGHMWQQTYGGSEVYTFDIDFRYRGTRTGMRFDYGPGIYKDASGRVMSRKTIPGGDSDCAYDGRTLTINGKPFTR